MKAEEYALCIVITIVSFLGFMVENIWLMLTKGYMDNRNMCLPFLLGYGLAVAAIYFLFGTPGEVMFLGKRLGIKNRKMRIFVFFLIVMVCVSVGEIVLGKLVEHFCRFYWWDYSKLPLHITRYTTIPTSMVFSGLITFFMHFIFAPLMSWLMTWNYNVLRVVAVLLVVCLLTDFFYNAYLMYKEKRMVRRWRLVLDGAAVLKKYLN